MKVDLIVLGEPDAQARWSLGDTHMVEPTPASVAMAVDQLCKDSKADAWLFWDPAILLPESQLIERLLTTAGDLWHAGLRLGMGGLPGSIDFVTPTWMLNRDPSPDAEATSWRISLRACLVRTEVLRQMDFIRPDFLSLEGAALEMGHRYVASGVITCHVPSLVAKQRVLPEIVLPFDDELRFIHYRFSRLWSAWFVFRSFSTGYTSVTQSVRSCRHLNSPSQPISSNAYLRSAIAGARPQCIPQVTVLIPTLDRYRYLRTLLDQLRLLSIKPTQIIVIDQTPLERRDLSVAQAFSDLPIHLLYQDSMGQCTARNTGLSLAAGDYVLFLDDDDEIDPLLIEKHLQSLEDFRAQVSCGVADEDGTAPLSNELAHARVSDVFPTNNAMIRKNVLFDSGLFDLAYDRGRNEDGDLGMRIYLSGCLMMLNPSISVVHHHAPSGGLREHNARVITYSSSRHRLLHRNVPSTWEIYQAMRYFTRHQVREMLWISTFGTFSIRGSIIKRVLKAAIGLLYLPDTLWQIKQNRSMAASLFQRFPAIPSLTPERELVMVQSGNTD